MQLEKKVQEVKSELEASFTDSEVKVQGNVVKIHVKEINGFDLVYLTDVWELEFVTDFRIKRSGTGMTIIVTLKD